ncbi:MAM and LDL-receptor class A domain-containing protein 1-like [Ischnura elegans]|uniref:MAM and LDL-receptor class A domain-containing protein 1-like n=1 Tax=Ischnura elegans TaxID=197161 RepID=UPI001ED87CB3|nr:MAM and LDL-receptor class A domain-containing protein 1-like [Ischnura elegans]XP_046406810.1 MAM and LDL-receptor class A domain-containing protein 1-like [Ischnura elegans]
MDSWRYELTGAWVVLIFVNALTAAPNVVQDATPDLLQSSLVRARRQEPAEICDFGTENDLTTCDWTNRNGTALRWEAGAGPFSNWLGGPARDATGSEDSDKGGYIYCEMSQVVNMPPDGRPSAFIESPMLETTGPEGKCVSFSYSMDGLSAAGLRVLLHPVVEEGGVEMYDRVLWGTKDSTQGKWMEAEVLYTYNQAHQVVFESIAKEQTESFRKYRGFVAVDNVALKPGLDCRGHCTFEGGLCSWTDDEDDDFDWSLGRGSRNPSTGPATDRSSFMHGGMEGGYAYIDSSFPRKPGDRARLSSTELEPTDPDSPLCLRFWTHLYGNGIGTLSIILRDEREEKEREIWSLSGEAGNAWYQAEVPVSSSNPFKIILSGEVGKNNLGDIAVDDLSFTHGSCPTTPQVAAPIPGDCSFEVDECGWSNVGSRERYDDLDWERISGQGVRVPSQDHTQGNEKGFFMALAKNNVQRPGSRAWIMSREFKGGLGPQCISFWYILNEPFIDNTGPSLGVLAIHVKTQDKMGNVNVTSIWKLYNHQGPEWRPGQAMILENMDYSIIIEGTWGSSRANGFIGFDDITFYAGACSTKPSAATVRTGDCRFERDICAWQNETQEKNSPSWRLATVSRRPANLPDKTFGAPEGYIYFDLFNQNAGSNMVRLISPQITATQEEPTFLCFSFWFAAFGNGDAAELRIVRQDNSSNSNAEGVVPEKIWLLMAKDMDTSRPMWTPAQVTVDSSTDFHLVLEGQATNGGFAIDDVAFTPRSCSIRPAKAEIVEEEQP